MSKPSNGRSAPLAVGVLAGLVLGAAATLFSIQACGDTAGPKAPNPAGSGSTTATPTTPPAPTNTPPPPT